nr:hypothetical protein [Clostridium sp. OF09-10]
MKKYLIALVMIVMIMSCFFGKTLVMANEDEDDASITAIIRRSRWKKAIPSGLLQKLIIIIPVCPCGNMYMS